MYNSTDKKDIATVRCYVWKNLEREESGGQVIAPAAISHVAAPNVFKMPLDTLLWAPSSTGEEVSHPTRHRRAGKYSSRIWTRRWPRSKCHGHTRWPADRHHARQLRTYCWHVRCSQGTTRSAVTFSFSTSRLTCGSQLVRDESTTKPLVGDAARGRTCQH